MEGKVFDRVVFGLRREEEIVDAVTRKVGSAGEVGQLLAGNSIDFGDVYATKGWARCWLNLRVSFEIDSCKPGGWLCSGTGGCAVSLLIRGQVDVWVIRRRIFSAGFWEEGAETIQIAPGRLQAGAAMEDVSEAKHNIADGDVIEAIPIQVAHRGDHDVVGR